MPTLLVVGAGLFGSQAAAYVRTKGWEARVFDPGLPGAASAAAAGLFKEAWAGRKSLEHYRRALPLLARLFCANGDSTRSSSSSSFSRMLVALVIGASPSLSHECSARRRADCLRRRCRLRVCRRAARAPSAGLRSAGDRARGPGPHGDRCGAAHVSSR